MFDEVPIRYRLLSPETIVLEMVSNVPHSYDVVRAEVFAGRVFCVKALIGAKPASQSSRELALEVLLNVVHPALFIITTEHSFTAREVGELARQQVPMSLSRRRLDAVAHSG